MYVLVIYLECNWLVYLVNAMKVPKHMDTDKYVIMKSPVPHSWSLIFVVAFCMSLYRVLLIMYKQSVHG